MAPQTQKVPGQVKAVGTFEMLDIKVRESRVLSLIHIRYHKNAVPAIAIAYDNDQ